MLSPAKLFRLLIIELVLSVVVAFLVSWTIHFIFVLNESGSPQRTRGLGLDGLVIAFILVAFVSFMRLHGLEQSLRQHFSETSQIRTLLFKRARAHLFAFFAAAIPALAFGYFVDPSATWPSFVVLIFVSFGFYGWLRNARTAVQNQRSVVRGTTMLSPQAAIARGQSLLDQPKAELHWGGVPLSSAGCEANFCFVGSLGSGKTVAMRLVMQEVLPRIRAGSDHRAVVFDPKGDFLPVIYGMGVDQERIVLLNPYDERSYAWDMAKDVHSPGLSLQMATTLIPPESHDANVFFTNAARAILDGVIQVFINTCQGVWTLRDLINATENPSTLKRILSSKPFTRGLIDQFFRRADTASDIRSTIHTRLAPLRTIAALWAKSERRFSLSDWATGESIVILGRDTTMESSLQAVNKLILLVMKDQALHMSESRTRRTWFFIDEARDAGKFDALPPLIVEGRSKGVRVALGFQDIEGLRTVYGEKEANELVGLCGNKALLRLDSDVTAEWAARVIGEAEFFELRRSTSDGKDGKSNTLAEHLENRKAVLASEVMRIDIPRNGTFDGFFIAPAVGVFKNSIHFAPRLAPLDKETLPFKNRPVADQYLEPWTDDDIARLHLEEVLRGPTASSLNDISRMRRGD